VGPEEPPPHPARTARKRTRTGRGTLIIAKPPFYTRRPRERTLRRGRGCNGGRRPTSSRSARRRPTSAGDAPARGRARPRARTRGCAMARPLHPRRARAGTMGIWGSKVVAVDEDRDTIERLRAILAARG